MNVQIGYQYSFSASAVAITRTGAEAPAGSTEGETAGEVRRGRSDDGDRQGPERGERRGPSMGRGRGHDHHGGCRGELTPAGDAHMTLGAHMTVAAQMRFSGWAAMSEGAAAEGSSDAAAMLQAGMAMLYEFLQGGSNAAQGSAAADGEVSAGDTDGAASTPVPVMDEAVVPAETATQPAAGSEPLAPAPAPPEPQPVSTSVPAPAAPDEGSSEAAPPAVRSVDAAEFDRARLRQQSFTRESSFTLELETREGDRIVLDFRQLDTLLRSRMSGESDGSLLRLNLASSSSERLVNMEITGDISEEERAAIEAVLAKVLEAANEFFSRKDGGDAMASLADLEIDADALMDVSLTMSMSRSAEALRYARNSGDGEAAVTRLETRDVASTRTLEFLADAQRTLVSQASAVLDESSSVRMVRTVLPALLSQSS